MNAFERKSTLVNRKFFQYLLPTILSNVAMSLNEFVDSIIVSHTLGTDAMGMVNLGYPVMFIFAVIYTCLGIGGSVVYAEYAGKQEGEKAKRSLSSVMILALMVSVILTVSALIFFKPLSGTLCKDPALIGEFDPYLRILILSGLLIIPIQIILNCLPALGNPMTGTVINIIANAVNLVMDYVYIQYFHTGLKGAAMATFTGYALGAVVLIFLCFIRKVVIPFTGFGESEIKELPNTCLRGAAPALNQLGYCIKVAFCNSLSFDLAGTLGVNIFTLCMQTVSIISIFIAGIIGAMMPIVAALHGQGDRKGIRMLMKTVMILQFITNLVLVALLELFPGIVLFLYNVKEDMAAPAILGLRIFSVLFVFRGFTLVFMYYFQIIERKTYALLISAIDGFLGIIPVSLILTGFMGVNGIWATFPMVSILLFLGIIVTNLVMVSRSDGKYRGLLLFENDEEIPVFDSTISLTEEDVVNAAKSLQEFCLRSDMDNSLSVLVALVAEEMGTYTMEQKESKSLNEIDLLVKVYADKIVMDVRSIGKPFDITSCEADRFSNIDVIRKTASMIEYGYVTGMNQTRICVSKR